MSRGDIVYGEVVVSSDSTFLPLRRPTTPIQVSGGYANDVWRTFHNCVLRRKLHMVDVAQAEFTLMLLTSLLIMS